MSRAARRARFRSCAGERARGCAPTHRRVLLSHVTSPHVTRARFTSSQITLERSYHSHRIRYTELYTAYTRHASRILSIYNLDLSSLTQVIKLHSLHLFICVRQIQS